MDKKQPYAHYPQGPGAPACWSQTQAAEAAASYAQPPGQNGYAANNYYPNYGGYYANTPGASYSYPGSHQPSYSYDQNNQAPVSSIPQGGYQPGYDYAGFYQPSGFNYPYSGSTYSGSYHPYTNSYPTYAPQTELKNTGLPPEPPQGPPPPPPEPSTAPAPQVPPSPAPKNPPTTASNSSSLVYGMKPTATSNSSSANGTKSSSHAYEKKPSTYTASRPSHSYGTKNNPPYASSKSSHSYGMKTSDSYSKPYSYGKKPSPPYPASKSSHTYGNKTSDPYGYKSSHTYGSKYSREDSYQPKYKAYVKQEQEASYSISYKPGQNKSGYTPASSYHPGPPANNNHPATKLQELHTLSPFEAAVADQLLEESSKDIYPPGSENKPPNPAFPPGIKKFFSRIFKKHPTALSNAKVHQVLISLVVDAAKENKLFKTNWEAHPAPSAVKALNPNLYDPKAAATKKSTKSKKDTAPKTSDSSSSDLNELAKTMQESHIKRRETEDSSRLNERIKRFKPINKEPPVSYRIEYQPPTEQNRADVIDWDDSTIIGTCQKHEKSYFRLTSQVDPSTVRPLHILQEWTDTLLVRWEQDKDYRYILDQFQAIRQDLTVQRIKNPFAVSLYEIVARFALENGDLGEFNKCQTKLIELYSYGIQGNECEFIAYRILYYLHTRSQSDINKTLTQLSKEQKDDEAIQHALQLRSALSSLNYVQFFQLYKIAPNLGKFLINYFLERERIRAMCIICTSFRQAIPVEYVRAHLGFESTEECFEFLKECGIEPSDNVAAPGYMTFSTRPVLPLVMRLSTKFNIVDLKGQIN